MSERANMKAIETEYRGYRFRSRLEARWAVFFDAIGAKWEYEPEGFELADGTKYLPDFLLQDVRGRGAGKDGKIYVEIKGNLTENDLHKIELFSGVSAGEMYGENTGLPIIIFGQIPEAEWKEGYWSSGIHYAYWDFVYPEIWRDGHEEFYNLLYSEGDYYWTEPKAGKGGGLVLDYPDNPYDFVDNAKTAEAYKAARQARFEHGEKPDAKVSVQYLKRNEPALYALGASLARANRDGDQSSVEFLTTAFDRECAEKRFETYTLYKAIRDSI